LFVAIAIAVRRSTPLHWLHRLSRPKTPRAPHAPRIAQPTIAYAANTDRWAILPGEYHDCDVAPAYATLPPLQQPGIGEPITCAMDGPTVLHLGGAWRGHVAFEGSSDGRFWRPVALLSLAGDASTEATHPGIWRTAPHTPVRLLRVRVLTLTAGAIAPAIARVPGMSAGTACTEVAA
jgi:hypothetical protein